VLVYDAIADQTKYGGLVALEAGRRPGHRQREDPRRTQGPGLQGRGATKCDYSGSVKLQVDIFLIFSISATYQVSENHHVLGERRHGHTHQTHARPLLQRWDAAARVLSIRLLVAPTGNPLAPIVAAPPGVPAFADAKLAFSVKVPTPPAPCRSAP
jgi:hypothetical protein